MDGCDALKELRIRLNYGQVGMAILRTTHRSMQNIITVKQSMNPLNTCVRTIFSQISLSTPYTNWNSSLTGSKEETRNFYKPDISSGHLGILYNAAMNSGDFSKIHSFYQSIVWHINCTFWSGRDASKELIEYVQVCMVTL